MMLRVINGHRTGGTGVAGITNVIRRLYSSSSPSTPPPPAAASSPSAPHHHRLKRSSLFIPVTFEDPADAVVTSHKLMLRTGMIRQLSSGIYSILPTGVRVLEKITAIVDQEMQSVGGQKVQLPKLITAELWKKTGRWDKYGDELIRLKDRKKEEFCLGPTHEEVITKLVANEVSSYNQLPLRLYQIGEKYRDEMRPRFGLIRGREFTMKDMYSFDVSKEAAYKAYDEVSEAYHRIMKRLSLNYYAVAADSGNIGGSRSHEFQVVSEVGEDIVLRCLGCGYAANVEIAVGKTSLTTGEPPSNLDSNSILDLYKHFATGVNKTKAIVFTAAKSEGLKDPKDQPPILLFTHEDTTPNPYKFKASLGLTQPPDELSHGDALAKLNDVSKACIMLDTSLSESMAQWIATQAVTKFGITEISIGHYRQAVPKDKCVQSGCTHGELESTKGIEVGHVFYLGTVYSSKLGANVTANGQSAPIEMGCYGIGVSRLLAALVESNHDSKGMVWPLAVAPYKVVVVSLASPKEPELQVEALKIYDEIAAIDGMRGEVVLDDRTERPGFKMTDAGLLGYPFMVVVGKTTKTQNKVEIEVRKTGEKVVLTREEMVKFFKEALQKQ